MAITVKAGPVNTTTYNVRGADLAAIWQNIERKGPVDPNEGRRYSGVCICTAVLKQNTVRFEFDMQQKGRKQEAEARISQGQVSYSCRIQIPKLSGSSLSRDAKREWDRFLNAVKTHENGHVKSYGKEVNRIAQEIDALRATASGADERAAQRAAHRAFAQKLGRISLEARINADAAKYDRQWDHGAGQGATLDTSIH